MTKSQARWEPVYPDFMTEQNAGAERLLRSNEIKHNSKTMRYRLLSSVITYGLKIFLFLVLLIPYSCIVQFIPEVADDNQLLVVESLITDQPEVYSVKLSKSLPVGWKSNARPLKGCSVKISDDLGNIYNFKESVAGTYLSDPAVFRGIAGRWYTLNINTNSAYSNQHYESFPMELKPVPKIDSIYYEKETTREGNGPGMAIEECNIYLDAHDPENNCKFYRWEYSEIWEMRLPYPVTNKICWVSNNSDNILIKNTSALSEAIINRYLLTRIPYTTDRLLVKYSMLVNQYSLNNDEYIYWEKLQNISEQVGGLYDITPSNIPSNIYCLNDPDENVLGYFSVSAVTSKRIFIKEYFSGIADPYKDCIRDTIFGSGPFPGLDDYLWVLVDNTTERPPNRVITEFKGCADCKVRGTTIEPVFWKEDK